MKRFVTAFFILSTLVGGVLAGTPLQARNDKMMKCCDKAKSKVKTPAVRGAMLCCAVNCSDPAPVSPGFSVNFAPSGVVVSESITAQIASLFPVGVPTVTGTVQFDNEQLFQAFQPKYIQHHSFLI